MIAFLAGFALAFQLGITPVTAGCPKLSAKQVAIPHDIRCIKEPSPVDKTCSFGCPLGYFLRDDPKRGSFRFVCQKNGTWTGVNHICADMWPPQIHGCPYSKIITAKTGSAAEVVSWKVVDVDDNSFQVDPNATVTVHSSHRSPYNFTIGWHGVFITATDKAGNTKTCHFTVTVRDIEKPTCSFCPSDIVKVAKSPMERVSWDFPVCEDNSQLPVIFSVNYQNGQNFRVPGKYKVQYIVEDHAKPRNVYTGCSFTITLKRANCPMYPPPKNGALACLNRKDDDAASLCQVACKDGTDFVFPPSMLYVCPYSGKWLHYRPFMPNPQLPWPNCASGVGPSLLKKRGYSSFFFNGNQTPAKVVSEIKRNFFGFLRSPDVPPFYCVMNKECSLDRVRVYI